jgi:pyruvate formate lyase activating enzyme
LSKSVEYEGKGIVLYIQRFSIDDGPGIRTTVFLKGCSLRCQWCANPEAMNLQPEIITKSGKCIKCGRCAEVCPRNAIALTEEDRKIDWSNCDLCLKCTEVCPSGAIERVGEYMSAKDVMRKEVLRDRADYQRSNGGMTLSGGEPTLQWQFALDLLKEGKKEGVRTALDTSGFQKWDIMEKILEYVDLVLFDIKHLDPEPHKRATGVSNELILGNLKKAMSNDTKIWIRCPVIPGFNDSEEYFKQLAKYLLSLEKPVEKIFLLPFHNLANSKYSALGRSYSYAEVPSPTEEAMEGLKTILESSGLPVSIGR